MTPAIGLPTVQYVNKPDLVFDYEVTKTGKSATTAAVLYVKPASPPQPHDPPGTRLQIDPTQWVEGVRVSLPTPANSPKLSYSLSGEGRFSFRVGVSSVAVTASRPIPADEPQLTVVFDETPPKIEKFVATPALQPNTNRVAIHWQVNEANPSDKPTLLEYHDTKSEKWIPLATRAGQTDCNWTIPADAPARVTLRLTVTDRAGNTTTKTLDNVNLDYTTPQGRLTGVTAVERKDEKKEAKPTDDMPLIPRIDEKIPDEPKR